MALQISPKLYAFATFLLRFCYAFAVHVLSGFVVLLLYVCRIVLLRFRFMLYMEKCMVLTGFSPLIQRCNLKPSPASSPLWRVTPPFKDAAFWRFQRVCLPFLFTLAKTAKNNSFQKVPEIKQKRSKHSSFNLFYWSEWEDSNFRPLEPHSKRSFFVASNIVN